MAIEIIPAVLGSSALVGLVSSLLTYLLNRQKQSNTDETKFRSELRSLIREERAETHACEAELREMRKEIVQSRVNEARCEERSKLLGDQMSEIRTAILREYVKGAPPVDAG